MQTTQNASQPSDGPLDSSKPAPAHPPLNLRPGLWLFLLLDAWVRLLVWTSALSLATTVVSLLDGWPQGNPLSGDFSITWWWGKRIGHWVLLFNLFYVLELVVLRLLLPTQKEGVYSMARPGLPPWQLILGCLIGAITKARLDAPFPGFLVFHVANLPPLCWLFGRVVGPRSRSCYVTEPVILDPHLVEIGHNVIIGLDAMISGHVQELDKVTIKRTIIEDDVLIGARAIIGPGCRLQKGCVIGAMALVLPGTTVGPNEFWRGAPARKVGMARPLEGASAAS